MTHAPSRGGGRPLVRLWTALVLVGLGLLLLAQPAAAHPFGPPPVAVVTSEDRTITVRWSAAADDLVALGHHLGVFSGTPTTSDDQPLRTGAQVLSESPAVATYVGRNIAVRQSGHNCDQSAMDLTELSQTGALVTFTCAEAIRTVDVEVSLLGDLHEAYRTALVIEGTATPQRAIASVHQPTATIAFGGGGQSGTAAAPTADASFQGRPVQLLETTCITPLLALALVTVIGHVHALAGRAFRR